MSARARLVIHPAGVGLLVLVLAGCATSGDPAPATGAVSMRTVEAPPAWQPGDRWVYGWTSGTNSGTKIIEVLEHRTINSVPFYVVRVGDLLHFYTAELHWAGSMRDGKVDSRMTPPQPWFQWPLEVGRRWSHQGVYEEEGGSRQRNDTFAVVAREAVEVPAGRFTAIKIVREAGSRDFDQYWYVPEIGFYAKWVGRRGESQFEEVLLEYRQTTPLIPEPARPAR
jgi:hypothetical protein